MKTQSLIPRSDYMSGKVTHSGYYAQFVTPGVIGMVRQLIGESRIAQSADPHFNDIPLKLWDQFEQYSPFRLTSGPLKECGDYLTLSAVVCIAKEAARQIKEQL